MNLYKHNKRWSVLNKYLAPQKKEKKQQFFFSREKMVKEKRVDQVFG
jgi:hypothetical protein